MTALQTALDDALSEIGIGLPDGAREKLVEYYDMLIDWNTRINLTAITDPIEVAQKHFADSLLPLAYDGLIPLNARCIDVGTGAGFPGIPLLLARGDLGMVLLDSLNKRLKFLEEVCSRFGIQAECIHARAEDGGQTEKLREQFDVVLTRAVASAPVLMELMLPFAAVGGRAIAYKGPGAAGEFSQARRAIRVLGGGPLTIETKQLSWGGTVPGHHIKSSRDAAAIPAQRGHAHPISALRKREET